MAELNTQTTLLNSTGNDLSPEMKTFYSRQLIELAGPRMVHDQFAAKRPIPKNNGKTIEFRRFDRLPKALKPITEGVTPDGNKLNVIPLTAQVEQYGDYVAVSDVLELTAIDPVLVEANKALANQAAVTLDTITREVLVAGTNKMFAPKEDGTEVTLRADVTADCTLTPAVIRRAVNKLKRQNAPMIDGSYVAIIHPDIACDLQGNEEWIEAHKYAQPENIFNGEIGRMAGCRFIESTEAKIIGPGEIVTGMSRMTLRTALNGTGSTTIAVEEEITSEQVTALSERISGGETVKIYVGGKEAEVASATAGAAGAASLTVKATVANVEAGALVCGGGAGADGSAIYCTIFLGDGAYGVTEINGGGLQYIYKPLGSAGTSDPLNQRETSGWKAIRTAVRLVEQYMVRVEHGSPSFGASAESN